MPLYDKSCATCGRLFTTKNSRQIYCQTTGPCAYKGWRESNREVRLARQRAANQAAVADGRMAEWKRAWRESESGKASLAAEAERVRVKRAVARAAAAEARKRPCVTCGRTFDPYGSDRGHCSRACKPPKIPDSTPRGCISCGDTFIPNGFGQRICDADCRRRYRTRKTRQKAKARPDWQYRKREYRDRRKARKRGVEAQRIYRRVVYRRDGWVCGICREPVDPELESPHLMAASLDHVIPLCRGGTHTYDNVQLAHFLCNSIKGATEDTDPRDRDLVTGQFVVAAMAAGG